MNVTAGPDLSLGEFSEVGETIEAIASSTATVVVGTVIDPELSDELRVTVVATGIGQAVSLSQTTHETDVAIVRNTATAKPVVVSDKRPDYSGYELPAVTRMARERRTPPAITPVASRDAGSAAQGLDYLDIPAFLRRQAD